MNYRLRDAIIGPALPEPVRSEGLRRQRPPARAVGVRLAARVDPGGLPGRGLLLGDEPDRQPRHRAGALDAHARRGHAGGEGAERGQRRRGQAAAAPRIAAPVHAPRARRPSTTATRSASPATTTRTTGAPTRGPISAAARTRRCSSHYTGLAALRTGPSVADGRVVLGRVDRRRRRHGRARAAHGDGTSARRAQHLRQPSAACPLPARREGGRRRLRGRRDAHARAAQRRSARRAGRLRPAGGSQRARRDRQQRPGLAGLERRGRRGRLRRLPQPALGRRLREGERRAARRHELHRHRARERPHRTTTSSARSTRPATAVPPRTRCRRCRT